MLLYDSLEDVQGKLQGTLCYYGGKATVIKSVSSNENGDFVLSAQIRGAVRSKLIKLDDPELNYTNYNIGYSNMGYDAVWWCRKPVRQYKQGLRSDQMKAFSFRRDSAEHNFGFSSPICDMLENNYSDIEICMEHLREGSAEVLAFHTNFAMSWDKIHKDFILEYKGRQIGSSDNLSSFSLMDEYKYLTEAIKEVIG